MTARKSSNSYNTKEIIRKPTLTDQRALLEQASIHTAEITAMREIQKRGHKMDNIYRLVELNARHQEQQGYPSNIKSDI